MRCYSRRYINLRDTEVSEIALPARCQIRSAFQSTDASNAMRHVHRTVMKSRSNYLEYQLYDDIKERDCANEYKRPDGARFPHRQLWGRQKGQDFGKALI